MEATSAQDSAAQPNEEIPLFKSHVPQDRFDRGPPYAQVMMDYQTITERDMRRLSRLIRSEPDWIENIDNFEKCKQWADVAKSWGMTRRELDYVYIELFYYIDLHDPTRNVHLSSADMVWYADGAVDGALADELKVHAVALENDAEEFAGSRSQVMHPIDPYLYPLVYEESICLPRPSIANKVAATWLENLDVRNIADFADYIQPVADDQGELAAGSLDNVEYFVPAHGNDNASAMYSWLPAEFQVDAKGDVAIKSYINNLHPIKHAGMYPIVEHVFAKMLPLFEQTLTDMYDVRYSRVIHINGDDNYDDDEESVCSSCDSDCAEDPGYHTDDSDIYSGNPFNMPSHRGFHKGYKCPVPKGVIDATRPVEPYSLKNRRLQGVVKMTTIELTPENPSYVGNNWSIHGMANELIVATGVYYYDVENISTASMKFSEPITASEHFMNSGSDQIENVYGIYVLNGEDSFRVQQGAGKVDIKEGRCFVYPNFYQQAMSPFKLADPSKPGHCKCMVIHFVDPTSRVPSTEVVPPQQPEWWADGVLETEMFSNIPRPIKVGATKYRYQFSSDEARNLKELMEKEYSQWNDVVTMAVFNPEAVRWIDM